MGCVEKESLRDDQTEPQVGGGGYMVPLLCKDNLTDPTFLEQQSWVDKETWSFYYRYYSIMFDQIISIWTILMAFYFQMVEIAQFSEQFISKIFCGHITVILSLIV